MPATGRGFGRELAEMYTMVTTISQYLHGDDLEVVEEMTVGEDSVVSVGIGDLEHAFEGKSGEPWIVWIAIAEPDRVGVPREAWEGRPGEPDLRLKVNNETVVEGFSLDAIGELCNDLLDNDDMTAKMSIDQAVRLSRVLDIAIGRARSKNGGTS